MKPNANLCQAIELAYTPAGFRFDNFVSETESKAYQAANFTLNNFQIKYREAKTTPTKVGFFVTFWKRNSQNITQPYAVDDNFDFLIIGIKNDFHFGQFIFPKSILVQQGILTNTQNEGKRGFRLYPPFTQTTNKQAKKTQQWQSDFYVDFLKEVGLTSTIYQLLKI